MKNFLESRNERVLSTYAQLPSLLREHYGIEETVLAGGYGYRQVMELIQNGADAILEGSASGHSGAGENRIQVLLRERHLYVANTGASLSEEGLDALLSSHSSPKRGNQIGRFGLGFKSLLRLGGRIDIFTRTTGAVRFDPHRCREELRQRFGVDKTPALRLAWPLPETEQSLDEVLGRVPWAETIVRVEVKDPDVIAHLRLEISEFPAEFLLFFPVATVLSFDDGDSDPREISVERDGDLHNVADGAEVSCWRVASREVIVSDSRAIADATHIHSRQVVPVSWAVPLEGIREDAGRFWAFFPTHTPTYLPGILNAPWKLNSDRNAIIGGEWNTVLMQYAARLVADTLPVLATAEDPGRPLEAFPRRLDRKDDDAAALVEALWGHLEVESVVPDAVGALRPARALLQHPMDNPELVRHWQAVAPHHELGNFVHATCLDRQRSGRLGALAERLARRGTSGPNLGRAEADAWFEAVASTEVLQASKVLKLAQAYADECKSAEWSSLRPNLAIVPSADGRLMPPDEVVLAVDGVAIPGRTSVAGALMRDVDARRILSEVLKVKTPDESVWLSVLRESVNVPTYPADAQDDGWTAFWSRLRAAPVSAQRRFLEQQGYRVRVRRGDGAWVYPREALLPGKLVDVNDAIGNQKLLVDPIHGMDGELLKALGLVDFPEGMEPSDGSDLNEWLEDCRSAYRRAYKNSASWAYLLPKGLTMPAGFGFLPKLRGASNAKLARHFLARMGRGMFVQQVEFRHSTTQAYPAIEVGHPLQWFILRFGTVEIGNSVVRLAAVASRRNEPAVNLASDWQDVLHVLAHLEEARPSVAPSAQDLERFWLALMDALATSTALESDSLEALWTGAAKDGVVPDKIGDLPIANVYVSGSPDLSRRARKAGRMVVTLDRLALDLWKKKGARDLSGLIKPEWDREVSPVDLLISAIPELKEVLRPEVEETAKCQSVEGLRLVIDAVVDPLPCLMWQGTLLLDGDRLTSMPRVQRIQFLVNEISGANWLGCSVPEALMRLGDARVEELRAHVAQGATLAERLLRAVGSRAEPLLNALGSAAGMKVVRDCTPLILAELALAQLGPTILPAIGETLADEGLQPPSRWNTSEARDFVAAIGFPEAFAASPETRREAEEFISGPIELPSLHDFQREVLEGIRGLVEGGTGRRRAVVSLPTGGGKTRVTVEAAVKLVLAPEGASRSVVWVAQTDELCEQAVQAFRQVWINLGAQRTDLRIVRLWGGNPNPAIQELNRPVVIVASIQTLNSRMGTDGLAWLRTPGLVVVDECHHAITPSYTNLLRWLDAEAPRPGAPARDEPPIVGLSATPFRTDDTESERLARRFDNLWLPRNQEELHSRLLATGVLARADYEALESGARLLDDELDQLDRFADTWEGLEFEKLLLAINQRLAGDEKRNQRIVECIRGASERSILLFSNSVEHAEEMSARLNVAGVAAATVSGNTPSVARRYFLGRFQGGTIRVLCNHSVLTTGFDAPRTDMVLIARQVFSPVRYMQMVGRGLRGEKNGGKPRCRIVTVMDNLGRFQKRHPYHYCRQYFSEMADNRPGMAV